MFVVDKAVYITRLDEIICISLKTVRGVHLPIAGSSFAMI